MSVYFPEGGSGGTSSSSGSVYFGGGSSGSGKAKGKHKVPKEGGSGGFFHNVIGDPINAAVGFLPAVYHASTAFGMDVGDVISGRKPTHVYHTIVEPLGQDPLVQDLWASRHPLRSSSIYNYLTGGKQPESQLVTQVKQGHLLVPALDVLGVASFGGARVGALAALPEGASAAEVRAAALRGRTSGPLGTITVRDTAAGAEIPTRTLPRNAYQAARMRAVDKALKAVTKPSTPLIGESARAARAITRETQPTLLRHLGDQRLATYQRAFSKLTVNQRVALGTLARVPLPEDLAGWKRILAAQDGAPAQRLLATLSDPKVLELYNDPGNSKRLTAAHEAAVALVGAREEILARTGALDPAAAEAAVYAPTRVARGAEFTAPLSPVDELTPIGATVRVTGKKAEGKLVTFVPDGVVVYYPRFGRTETVALADLERVEKPRLIGGGTPEEIAAEIAAAGRPQPFYPGKDTSIEAGGRAGSRETAALTPPVSDVRGSKRILFRTGQLALHPDTLTPSFLRAARYDYRLEKHAAVKRIATPIAEDAGLPKGMRWVREIRGEKIGYTETTKGEHLAELDKVLPTEEKSLTAGEHEKDAVVARDEKGRRLAVTDTLARGLESEYRATNRALRWFVQKPLDVWRALVLNLRIPWLINNIVGNNILFALRFAGIDGLKAYVGLLSEPVKTRLLKSAATTRHLTAEDIAAIFPEQTRGTFIGTQTPTVGGKLTKGLRVAGAGLAPLDRRTEQALRRAAVETVLRGSPEVKALYRAMPKETRSLRAAMTKAASDSPDLRRLANTEANRALGDYLSLNDFERGALRRVAPFYGWYREILRIAAHAVVDTPIRTAFLTRFALIEQERQQDIRGPFPSYLEGSVALGAGPQDTERILALRSANPFSTVADEIRAASFLAGDHSRASASAVLGMGNPFAVGLLEYLTAAAKGDPTRLTYQGPVADTLSRGGPIGAMAGEVFGGLPQTQVLAPPPPSKLYPTRDRNELLLRLLGDIRRNVNQGQASLYASQGR